MATAAGAAKARGWDGPLTGLPGLGPRRAELYARAGLGSRRELLYHLPVRFRVRPQAGAWGALEPGTSGAVSGVVLRSSVRRRGRRSTVSLRVACDGGGEVTALLFNRPYLASSLGRGTRVWLAGRRDAQTDRLVVSDYERLGAADGSAPEGEAGDDGGEDATGGRALVPIYRLPRGIPPRVHRKALAALLGQVEIDDWREALPDEPSLGAALAAIHLADDLEAARRARRRLARDEAFALSLEVAERRRALHAARGAAVPIDEALHRRLLAWLPHEPTAAQRRALDAVRTDLAAPGGRPMGRLLQGDVGSGKTLVAFYALLAAALTGRQAALMAPTELLARQHVESLRALIAAAAPGPASAAASGRGGGRAPRVVLVSASGTPAERRAVREALRSGAADLAVGTHGLASGGVRFADLALTVVDEQHRFGVRQRVRLRGKGAASHLLVMTATPIPRTLALTAYGELDLSIIDELPPGRAPRATRYVPRAEQPALWRRLADDIAQGRQGYVVCPSIGDRAGDDAARQSAGADDARAGDAGPPDHSVAATLAAVRRALPGAAVAAVHGRMRPAEQQAVLDAFRAGAVSVLVATVLIEVGLDVPAASFVVVPDPSRFGLATLHQIRGRVGRGSHAGSCYLLGPLVGAPVQARVEALVDSQDGFALAERDLALRGPGELLGTRQSGMPSFSVLDPVRDAALLAEARSAAFAVAEELSIPALRRLRERAFPRLALHEENLLAGG